MLAVGNQRVASLLPNVVKSLSHDRPEVRIAAAQAVPAFGSRASPYLQQLQRALASETDAIARKTIEGAISQLVRAR